jgi:branched-chain amino acid transport system ATP-binding protein
MMNDAILETQRLSRRFGGLMATNNLAIELHRGKLHAVLGPNGAGKTTLINLLSGDLRASSGSIRYKGEDITRYSADRRSRLGIGRSYQKTNIFPAFTAFENCRLAAQSRIPRALHIFANALNDGPVCEAARHALEAAGLSACGDRVASTLSHGEQRQLEIAMARASEPTLMMLDEPASGLSRGERVALTELLLQLDPKITLILIEHDMDVALRVADRVTMMHDGRVIVEGTPDEIRANQTVHDLYLGRGYQNE